MVDIVSPANRTTPAGRKDYLTRREEFRRACAHLVELDLVLQGQSCLDLSAEGLPDWDYVVSVCRAQQPDRYEVYTTTLQKRLPRFRLPLASDDRDTVVDLQAVFPRCYEQLFAGQIDYQKDPHPAPKTRLQVGRTSCSSNKSYAELPGASGRGVRPGPPEPNGSTNHDAERARLGHGT